MTAERWRRIEQFFERAIACNPADQRDQFVPELIVSGALTLE